ncbi:MFS transporter [Alicyclobacillus ferrooxydans]|uniref:Major facilitator superfamily (MFS) profile domain-containing protein n=1 Tax=Alicyclobacillus ferrooxydans TaxID=471514 RepID=A0A0P9CHN9_9BACL|nr:MFS transporter [Alicyclobacillus ferrooxydans]KPV45258.1 hypothetical protein AN477_02335 [Alicyclobacillus ferrooxydans]
MTSTSRAESRQEKYGIAFIAAIMLCVILNPLNSSTISVALPVLLSALHTTSSGITWIISGYYLGSAIAQPVMGKLGDAWGRARFVYIGLALMIFTAVLAPFSNELWLFVFWRVVQAVGTSMIYPNAVGLLRQYRSGDIGRILGWIGMAGGVAVAVGPTIGGFLIDLASWHSIFWLNIPLSVVAMVLLWRILPKGNRADRLHSVSRENNTAKNHQMDVMGILLFASAVTAWLLWSNSKHPFANAQLLTLVLGVILTTGLIVAELRHTSPIIPVRWFSQSQFTFSSLITVLANLVMYCILYGLPVLLETVRKFTATGSGLVLLAFAGVMSLASPLGGHLAQSQRRRIPILLAGLLLFAGVFILCWVNSLSVLMMVLALALIGVSFSISNVVIQKIVLDSAPHQDTGQASGVYTLLRYLGTILSSVLVGSSISTASGARTLFIILSVVSMATVLLSFGLRDNKPQLR